jgi:hypothetical protein
MSGMRTWARWWFRAPDGRGYRRRQADAIMAAAGLGAVILCGAPVAGRLAGVALVAFAVALWSYLPSGERRGTPVPRPLTSACGRRPPRQRPE